MNRPITHDTSHTGPLLFETNVLLPVKISLLRARLKKNSCWRRKSANIDDHNAFGQTAQRHPSQMGPAFRKCDPFHIVADLVDCYASSKPENTDGDEPPFPSAVKAKPIALKLLNACSICFPMNNVRP
ncbi:uncharacterized protein MEPE_05767 [Melanopsichium pennsylvanicum]|uniref:Uncharacterized protein n=1 Tax=Melanopsichium pennsylvanicum TaxID=63383 RepID=A0AAJ4XSJ2_9BASI|nr:uncharacterized protein MEPE_05767 [Melanopsichium pennsylvanicum]